MRIAITPSSFVNLIVDSITWTLGGAAPGVAPTPQKRSPWRPPRTGRQGKLPLWTAGRCRVLRYLSPYRDLLITWWSQTDLMTSQRISLGTPLPDVARRARAMVRGMAMAAAARGPCRGAEVSC